MFALMQSTRLESLHLSVDSVTGLKAVIAIHNSRLGPALGGCRYLAYPSDESAIEDAVRLAQGMSYKAALAGLAQGEVWRSLSARPMLQTAARCSKPSGAASISLMVATSPPSTAALR